MHRVVAQLKRRLASQGREHRGRRRSSAGGRAAHVRASLETGGVPLRPAATARAGPKRPELYVLCDVSTSVTSASVFFLSVLHALHDSFRKLRSFVFVERISEVTDVFERERSFEAVSRRDRHRRRRGGRVRLHRLRPRLARVPRQRGRRPRPALDGDRAGRRPHERARAARRRLRARGRARPGARSGSTPSRSSTGTTATRSCRSTSRYCDRRLRVLDDQAARGVRERRWPTCAPAS